MRARKHVALREKLAAALAELLPAEQRDDLRARKVPAKVVIALFQQDHNVLHALGGSDRWWNLTPMLVERHRAKAARDTSIVAKVRRIAGDDAKWRGILAPKKRRRKASRWPSRPLSRKVRATIPETRF